MKEKILLFLGALSVREKALLFITALLLGAFLGMKASQSVLESFFDYDLTQLNEQKRLAQSSKDLYALVQAQKREFAELSELVAHFDNDEKAISTSFTRLQTPQISILQALKTPPQRTARLLNIAFSSNLKAILPSA